MQISRHWRLKPQRYRLEGVRYENGEVALQERPTAPASREREPGRSTIVDHTPEGIVAQVVALESSTEESKAAA